MLKSVKKWRNDKYNSLSLFWKTFIVVVTVVFLGFIIWCSLSWLGIWSIHIRELKSSDVGKDWLNGFVYSLKFLFINENNKPNWVIIGGIGVFFSYWITVKENAKKLMLI